MNKITADCDYWEKAALEARDMVADLRVELKQAEQRLAEVEKKYQELLHAVVRKHPDESRHETALRYIIERESAPGKAVCLKSSQ